MYAVTMAMKKKKKAKILATFKSYLRSVVLGTIQATSVASINCIMRNLTGRFEYYSVGFLPAFLSGFFIFIDDPDRRIIVTTTFISMTIEGIIRRLVQTEVISRSRIWETLCFMVLNSIFMRKIHLRMRQKLQTPWFYVPASLEAMTMAEDRSRWKPYNWRKALDVTLKYLSAGILLSAIKTMMYGNKIARKNVKFGINFEFRHFRFAWYIAAYVGLFEVVSGALNDLGLWKNSTAKTMVSGLVAGASYAVYPSLQLMSSLTTVLVKCLGEDLKIGGCLPDWPYLEMTYPFCSGFLVHLMVMHPEACPKFFKFMIGLMSSNEATKLVDNFHGEVLDYMGTSSQRR